MGFSVLINDNDGSGRRGWMECGSGIGKSKDANLFVTILSGKTATSLMFPLISAGGIIVTYVISRFFYKENLSERQLVGFILGTVSVICLSV